MGARSHPGTGHRGKTSVALVVCIRGWPLRIQWLRRSAAIPCRSGWQGCSPHNAAVTGPPKGDQSGFASRILEPYGESEILPAPGYLAWTARTSFLGKGFVKTYPAGASEHLKQGCARSREYNTPRSYWPDCRNLTSSYASCLLGSLPNHSSNRRPTRTCKASAD